MIETSNRVKLKNSSIYISPLPSVLVSCRGTEPPYDKDNIIAIARTTSLTTDPPMVCIAVKDERFSYHQIKQSGEFVINLVNRELCRVSDWCGVKSGSDYDKFRECGLTAVPVGGLEIARGVAESPVSIGCRVVSTVEKARYGIFIGEIVSVEANPDFIGSNGKLDLVKTRLVEFCALDYKYYENGECLGFYGYSQASKEAIEKKLGR